MANTTTSRRAVLAGLAATPVAAVPAVALAGAHADPKDIVARFRALSPEVRELFYAMTREHDEYYAYCELKEAEEEAAARDPIFAKIEAHRVALQISNEAIEDDDPSYDAEGDALADLIETTPTTLTGCAALFAYLSEWGERNEE
jgi:hypothetical protein